MTNLSLRYSWSLIPELLIKGLKLARSFDPKMVRLQTAKNESGHPYKKKMQHFWGPKS